MWSFSRFWEKICTVAEGGSHYCSKKTDDICGDAYDEVNLAPPFFFFVFVFPFLFFFLSIAFTFSFPKSVDFLR